MLFYGIKASAPEIKEKRYENYHVCVAFSENYEVVGTVKKPRPEKCRDRPALFQSKF